MIFENRKVYLIGKKSVVYGFKYLFDWAQQSDFIDIDEINYLETIKVIVSEEHDNVYIICMVNPLEIITIFHEKGLKKGIDYYLADDLLYLLDFPIEKIDKNKNIFIWGTGDDSEYFINYFNENYPQISITGFIDSNLEKQGLSFHNRLIYAPEYIMRLDNIFIIIATSRYYDEIKRILNAKGLNETEDYIHSSLINRKASKIARKVLYAERKSDFFCDRPFKFIEILDGGVVTTCCGIIGLAEVSPSMFYSPFLYVWHSNVLKIIRLSISNGSYIFCNPLKCEYIYDCKGCMVSEQENEATYNVLEDDYPRTVQFSFDKSCNLYCSSCRNSVFIEKGENADKLTAFANRMNEEVIPHIKRIKFAGGETCISEIYKTIIWGNHSIDEIAILSNGSLMNRAFIENLSRKYKKIDIVISMDGATKETAEKLRRGIRFENWTKNMDELARLREEGIINLLGFTFVVQRENFKEMKPFVEMCMNNNADYIRFSRLMQWGSFTEEEFEYKSLVDKNGKALQELQEVTSDEIFDNKRIKLFGWIEWFI